MYWLMLSLTGNDSPDRGPGQVIPMMAETHTQQGPDRYGQVFRVDQDSSVLPIGGQTVRTGDKTAGDGLRVIKRGVEG
jgi:hypothetical protein